jgi:hypothetical protein
VTSPGSGRLRGVAAAATVAAALVGSAVLVVVIAGRSSGDEQPSSARHVEETALPASPEPAFTVAAPVELTVSRSVSHWANVLEPAAVHESPSDDAPVLTRLSTQTPESTSNIVLVLGRATDDDGRLWVHVRLPILPNDRTGWVRRSALGVYGALETHLVVDVSRLTATLFRGGRKIFQAPVGVGQSQWPTPTGKFYIRNKLVQYQSPYYGPLAFGTSARSSVLTDWPAGGFIGIHGTNEPELLPGRVSHGCIRMRNVDILRLGRLMPVGTPLTIR